MFMCKWRGRREGLGKSERKEGIRVEGLDWYEWEDGKKKGKWRRSLS